MAIHVWLQTTTICASMDANENVEQEGQLKFIEYLQHLFTFRCPYCKMYLPTTKHLNKCHERYKHYIAWKRRKQEADLLFNAVVKSRETLEQKLIQSFKESK